MVDKNDEIVKDVIDEKDTTLEDVELVDEVKTTVEFNDEQYEVEVGYDKEGNSYVKELPEGITEEQETDFLELIAKDKRVDELGKTLSKYKTKRTEQNQYSQDFEDLKGKHKILVEKFGKLEEENVGLKKTEQEKDTDISIEAQVSSINKLMRKKLGVETDTEVAQMLVDDPTKYSAAYIKAKATSDQSFISKRLDKVTQLSAIERKQDDLVRSAQVEEGIEKPSEVLTYAITKNLLHLDIAEIIKFYKVSHLKSTLQEDHNKIIKTKLNTPRVLRRSSTAVTSKKRIEDMTNDEIMALPQDDPRYVEYCKKHGL